MPEAAQNCLVPDLTVLSRIPELNDITICKYRIISSNIDTCTFVTYFEEDQSPRGLPTHLLVRIEKRRDGNSLFATAALQKLAHLRLPHLVPKVWGAGHTQTVNGTQVSYMLSQFYTNACTLDSVWDGLDTFSQYFMTKQVVSLMSQLHDISLGNLSEKANQILRDTPFETTNIEAPIRAGGPSYGYFHDFGSFLMTMLKPGKARYSINQKPDGGIAIQMQSPQIEGFGFAQTDLDLLAEISVLCHNDLEPRNILVRPVTNDENRAAYEVVAIIGWKMAGFFPFVFEVGHKDTCLGLRNQSWSWYTLFRQCARRIISEKSPGARPIYSKLIRAMILTDVFRKESNKLNAGNLVQKLWLERERLEYYDILEKGYVKKANAGNVEHFTAADNAELEQAALRRLGYIE